MTHMFCKCGTIMRIPDTGDWVICRTCKRRARAEFPEMVFEKTFRGTPAAAQEEAAAPKIKQKCPVCGAEEMRYSTIQTRSADEGQTIFYSCSCGYKTKVDS